MKSTKTANNRNDAIKKRTDEDKENKKKLIKEKEITPVFDGIEFLTVDEFTSHSIFKELREAYQQSKEAFEKKRYDVLRKSKPDLNNFITKNYDEFINLMDKPYSYTNWRSFIIP